MRSLTPVFALRVFGLTMCVAGAACPADDPDDGDSMAETTATGATSTTGRPPGSGFLIDLGTPSGVFECSMWLQDCALGEKCMPYANDGGPSWNGTRCSPIEATPDAVGDECTVVNNGVSGLDSCEAGAVCWNVDGETNRGTCAPFCTGTPDNPVCSEPGMSCTVANDGAVIVCLPDCDPVLQDCVNAEEACYPSGDVFVCAQEATDPGPDAGGFGAPCEYINACRGGFACANASGIPGCTSFACCTPFCDVSDPEVTCPEGQECAPFFEATSEEDLDPDLAAIGICLVPQ